MQISEHFDIREFVPKGIWDVFKEKSIWFINPALPPLAEFYKAFLKKHYNADNVLIIINNWHSGGQYQFRGYRPRSYNEGGENSQHRLANAFDCDIMIVKNSVTTEANYQEIQNIIIANEAEFMKHGLTTIEDIKFAPTWLHSDCRNTGLINILIVKP